MYPPRFAKRNPDYRTSRSKKTQKTRWVLATFADARSISGLKLVKINMIEIKSYQKEEQMHKRDKSRSQIHPAAMIINRIQTLAIVNQLQKEPIVKIKWLPESWATMVAGEKNV